MEATEENPRIRRLVLCECSYKCSRHPEGMQMIPESTRRKHLRNSEAGLVHRSFVEATADQVQQTVPRIDALCFCHCQICAETGNGRWVSRRTFNRHQRESEWSAQQFNNLFSVGAYGRDEANCQEDDQADNGYPVDTNRDGANIAGSGGDDTDVHEMPSRSSDSGGDTDLLQRFSDQVFRPQAESGLSRALSFDEAFQEKVIEILAFLDEHKCSMSMQNGLLRLLFGGFAHSPNNALVEENLVDRLAPEGYRDLPLARMLTLAGSNWTGGERGECTPNSFSRATETLRHRGLINPEHWKMCTGTKTQPHLPQAYGPDNEHVVCTMLGCSVGCSEMLQFDYIPLEGILKQLFRSRTFCHDALKGEPFNIALMDHWDGFQAASTVQKDCWTVELFILNGGRVSIVENMLGKPIPEMIENGQKHSTAWRVLTEEGKGANSRILEHVLGNGEIFDDIVRHGHHDLFWVYAFERLVSAYNTISTNNRNSEITYTKYFCRQMVYTAFNRELKDRDGFHRVARTHHMLEAALYPRLVQYRGVASGCTCHSWYIQNVCIVSNIEKAKELAMSVQLLDGGSLTSPCVKVAKRGIGIGPQKMVETSLHAEDGWEESIQAFWTKKGVLTATNAGYFRSGIQKIRSVLFEGVLYKVGDCAVVQHDEADREPWLCKITAFFIHSFEGFHELLFAAKWYELVCCGTKVEVKPFSDMRVVLEEPTSFLGDNVRPTSQLLHKFFPHPTRTMFSRRPCLVAYEMDDMDSKAKAHLLKPGLPGCCLPWLQQEDIVVAKAQNWSVGMPYSLALVRWVPEQLIQSSTTTAASFVRTDYSQLEVDLSWFQMEILDRSEEEYFKVTRTMTRTTWESVLAVVDTNGSGLEVISEDNVRVPVLRGSDDREQVVSMANRTGFLELIEDTTKAAQSLWITNRRGAEYWPSREEKAKFEIPHSQRLLKPLVTYVPPTIPAEFKRVSVISSRDGPLKLPVKPGHVLIKHIYAGVNASDVNFSSGRYFGGKAALPFNAGFEAVGVVASVGDGVGVKLVRGSPVALMNYGGFSKFSEVPLKVVIPMPLVAPELVAILTSGLTASIAETVLVTAAAGGTGQFAVQVGTFSLKVCLRSRL
ncbi:hypothetical protein R1sor_027070 [Riccia sorocarpa]|uniref:Alcohol dehydrogenase-like N-terminal domain-containing protein n=1 Tax=Riccia sorocarpa TaxID=122646 RepID=A0ABD3GG27_9MARC